MLTISNEDCLKRVRLANDTILNHSYHLPSYKPNTLFSVCLRFSQSQKRQHQYRVISKRWLHCQLNKFLWYGLVVRRIYLSNHFNLLVYSTPLLLLVSL